MQTIASLQTEREQLKAANAKHEFEQAFADTCAHAELILAAQAVQGDILQAIETLVQRFTTATKNETDETRVHFLMADAAHDWLTGITRSAAQTSAALPIIGEHIAQGARPRDLLTVSQWADRKRVLKTGTNSPGRWRTSLTPYLKEIMDALSEHSPVRQVTFIKSSGVGGTEVMFNWIGYTMEHLQNKDMLLVVPTLELRDRSLNPRLNKMIDETDSLAELVSNASRNKTNRVDLMEYGAHTRMIKAGANSPDSLRSDHLPYVICDEVDAFPWDVGGEGDPMTLIENRQRTFSRAKTYLVSTPTLENQSRIHQLYLRTDRRQYHVPCPHCGEYQTLEWRNLKYRTAPQSDEAAQQNQIKQVIDAVYMCAHCAAEINEGHKTDMLAAGRWIAERSHIKLHRGYHINALYAPIGLGLGWKAVAQKWLNSQHDTSEMKGFINTYLGEVWREQGDSIEAMSLMTRLENYTLESLRTFALITTAGVDVQKDRLEVSIAAWDTTEQCWLVDHIILPGDTTAQPVWDDLHDTLTSAGVRLACIDAGYNTSMVYAFCQKRSWCIATKGMAGGGRPLIEDDNKRRQRLRYRRKKGVPVEPIGVDQGKALIYARLKQIKPGDGYIHFPGTPAFDDEYFAQLAAEKLVTRMRGSRPFQEWVQTRPRNEALDCLLLALAAYRLLPAAAKLPKPTKQAAQPVNRKPAAVLGLVNSEWGNKL